MSSSTTPRRRQDRFGHKARAEGYAARSVYKLQEIDQKLRLFRAGQRVLDLGAFPGSWTQYAASVVGPKGYVLGLDLQPFRGVLPSHAEIRQADLLAASASDFAPPESFDVVVSDMAPATTGQRHVDQYRSFELFMHALAWADELLRPKGCFVGKIFQGPEFQEARKAMSERFSSHRIVKPEASRAESYEVFLVGIEKKSRQ
jgi:23S rRNA (uridine2552-2'-O)-methyltransferase